MMHTMVPNLGLFNDAPNLDLFLVQPLPKENITKVLLYQTPNTMPTRCLSLSLPKDFAIRMTISCRRVGIDKELDIN